MSDLYLVRHGQASFGADNYDQLSPLGYQQARWLGEYFAERDVVFDRNVTGSLARQLQTAESILLAFPSEQQSACELEVHPGFNEFDFHTLVKLYWAQNSTDVEVDWSNPKYLFKQLRLAIKAWSKGELNEADLGESWQDFNDRIKAAVWFGQQSDTSALPVYGNTLVVSSGGALSTALSHLLGFGVDSLIDVNLQYKNTGVSHCVVTRKKSFVTSFNNVPHLDRSERFDSITYA